MPLDFTGFVLLPSTQAFRKSYLVRIAFGATIDSSEYESRLHGSSRDLQLSGFVLAEIRPVLSRWIGYANTSIFSSVIEISLDPHKSPFDVIPLRGQHTEKPSVTTVTNGDVNDLRWGAEQQRSIVEVHILTEDNETLYSAALPYLRVRSRQ